MRDDIRGTVMPNITELGGDAGIDAGQRREARHRAVAAVAIGIATYGVSWLFSRFITEKAGWSPMLRQWTFDASLVVISLVIWRATGRPWKDLGLRWPVAHSVRWRWYAAACAVMVPASIAAVYFRVSHPTLQTMTPLQVIVSVWFISSIAEETFARGLVQSFTYARESFGHSGYLDIAVSSLVFAGMHAALLWIGMSPVGVAIIIATTASIGAIAAIARRVTGSILHCVGIHTVSNAVGVVLGSVLVSLR